MHLVRLKTLVKFPARVLTEGFLTVRNAAGTYIFGVDYTKLGQGVGNPARTLVAAYDQDTREYKTASFQQIAATGLPVTEAATYDALRALSPASLIDGQSIRMLEYHSGFGGGGLFVWRATSTATHDGAKTISLIGGGTGRFVRLDDNNPLTVKNWGAKGNNANDDAALTAAINDWKSIGYDSTSTAGGLGTQLDIPPGCYNFSNTLAFGKTAFGATLSNPELHLNGLGRPILKHTGSGAAIDLMLTSQFAPRLSNFRVLGNANSIYLIKGDSLNHAFWQNIDLRDCNPTYPAMYIQFAVLSEFQRIKCGKNFTSVGTTPNEGIQIGSSTILVPGHSISEYSVNVCVFDVIIEGVKSVGLSLENSQCCTYRGTSEGIGNDNFTPTGNLPYAPSPSRLVPGVGRGVNVSSISSLNIFDRLFCEFNGNSDFVDNGHHNIYLNCTGSSPKNGYGTLGQADYVPGTGVDSFIITGHDNHVEGGIFDSIAVQSPGHHNTFINVDVLTSFNVSATCQYKNIRVAGTKIPDRWSTT